MSVPAARLQNAVSDPLRCIQRIQQAINAHNLDALTACFAHNYESDFPAHPERAFQGHSQLRANWSQFFELVPDIHAELVRSSEDGQTVWAEWEWHGTRVDGMPFLQRGVTIQQVHAGEIAWVRLYIEPVATDGHDIASVSERRNA